MSKVDEIKKKSAAVEFALLQRVMSCQPENTAVVISAMRRAAAAYRAIAAHFDETIAEVEKDGFP